MTTPAITTPHLGTCTPSPKFGEPSGFIGIVRELTPAEVESYQQASLELSKYIRKRQLLQLVCVNQEFYRTTIQQLTQEFVANPAVTFERGNSMVLSINCALLNFLSGVKTFLDHEETALNREFKRESQEFQNFKKATANEYDSHFEYRFMYKLRNFTQHCGMPIGELKLDAVSRSLKSPEVATETLEPLFVRDYLLNNFREWGNPVTGELQAMPPKFAVAPFIEEYAEGVRRIETAIIAIQRPTIENHLKCLETLVNEIRHLEGSPCIYTKVSPNSVGAEVSYERFPIDAMQELRAEMSAKPIS